jgi:hypothetical protein
VHLGTALLDLMGTRVGRVLGVWGERGRMRGMCWCQGRPGVKQKCPKKQHKQGSKNSTRFLTKVVLLRAKKETIMISVWGQSSSKMVQEQVQK